MREWERKWKGVLRLEVAKPHKNGGLREPLRASRTGIGVFA